METAQNLIALQSTTLDWTHAMPTDVLRLQDEDAIHSAYPTPVGVCCDEKTVTDFMQYSDSNVLLMR
jgi:hypothetical protein